MDALSILLSRIQMATSLSMHILFPTLNIGLALFLFIMEAMWLKTQNPIYLRICKYWMKIFALAFGMGVVSGIVMAYQLGTNFGKFTYAIGEVLGSLFVYEVLTAFFLEAGFLGVMLFGWNKVSKKMHFFSTSMVMLGTFVSAFWILSANSWMQYPSGYTLEANGHFMIDSWWEIIFNPTMMPRFFHMILASYITCTFFIAGVSAYYLLKNKFTDLAKRCLSFAMWSALILVPTQIILGDTVGLNVHTYQPLKTAAIEGVWETQKAAPLVLFGFPDLKQEKNLYTVEIPYGASLINTHSLDGELIGLKSVPKEDRPVIWPTFYGFRIMVGVGLLFLLVAIWGMFLRRGGKLYTSKGFLRTCVSIIPLGFLATIAGWFTAESGRQPWVVYEKLRTSAGASDVTAVHVGISLTTFIVVYTFVLCFFLFYLIKFIQRGPTDDDEEERHTIGYMVPEGENQS